MDTSLEGMKYGLLFFSAIMMFAELLQAKKLYRFNLQSKKYNLPGVNYVWVKMGLGICGLLWTSYQLKVIFFPAMIIHPIVTQGLFLVTIALVSCGALLSLWRIK